jgi:hypothetical protein
MIGLRLPMTMLRKVDKIAAARSSDRSDATRWLIGRGLDSGMALLLLRTMRKRKGATDRILDLHAQESRAMLAEQAAKRAKPSARVKAEIKALREREQAERLASSEADRIALARVERDHRR